MRQPFVAALVVRLGQEAPDAAHRVRIGVIDLAECSPAFHHVAHDGVVAVQFRLDARALLAHRLEAVVLVQIAGDAVSVEVAEERVLGFSHAGGASPWGLAALSRNLRGNSSSQSAL